MIGLNIRSKSVSKSTVLFYYAVFLCISLMCISSQGAAAGVTTATGTGSTSAVTQTIQDDPIPVKTKCYKAVHTSDIYLAMTFDEKIVNPPLYFELDLKVSITTTTNALTPDEHRIRFYFIYEPKFCTTSLSFSKRNLIPTQITLSGKIYTGVESAEPLYTFEIEVDPAMTYGLKRFYSQQGLVSIYVYYRSTPADDTPAVALPPINDLAKRLNIKDFKSVYMCIAAGFKVFVVRPMDWTSQAINFPRYKSVVIRVYSDKNSVFFKRYFAWPCPDGIRSFDYIRPRFIVDDYVENPTVVFTVEPLSVKNDPIAIPWEDLSQTPHFETTNMVQKLSSQENWLDDYDVFFLFETVQREGRCDQGTNSGTKLYYNVGISDEKIVEAWNEVRETEPNSHFTSLRHQRIDDMAKCNTAIRVV